MRRVTDVLVDDVRFPPSRPGAGSDAVHSDPEYSAAYLTIVTDDPDVPQAHSLVFTLGRGTEVVVSAIDAMRAAIVGLPLHAIVSELGAFARFMASDSQLRWLGPSSGVLQMALGGVVNAAWDLAARLAGEPLWRYIATMPTENLLETLDLHWLSDALTRDEAGILLDRAEADAPERLVAAATKGIPAYTTSAGWLGYDDAAIVALARRAVHDGFGLIKLKVGADLGSDVRRVRLVHEALPDVQIAVDANQAWSVPEAVAAIAALSEVCPLAWVEEPTSCDDVLGYVEIARHHPSVALAGGEHTANSVLFKQFLATKAIQICQIDACRVAGVNENLAILLLARKFGVPVCPHAGGVGLCEMVQHLALADFVRIGGHQPRRIVEWVDELHQHFVEPARVRSGHYVAPHAAGFSTALRPESLEQHRRAKGLSWTN